MLSPGLQRKEEEELQNKLEMLEAEKRKISEELDNIRKEAEAEEFSRKKKMVLE